MQKYFIERTNGAHPQWLALVIQEFGAISINTSNYSRAWADDRTVATAFADESSANEILSRCPGAEIKQYDHFPRIELTLQPFE